MARQTVAAFDFDGTITTKDTLIEFIRFTHGTAGLTWGFFVMMPVLVLYKIKVIPNYTAKQIVFAWFYKGWSIEKFDEKGKAFASHIGSIINPAALAAIRQYENDGAQILILTASVENWVLPWAESVGINTVLGTQIEIDSTNKITGRFLSKNCYGQEKVERLLQIYPNRESYILEAYGDSRGDKELLAFADTGYFKKF